MGVTIVFHICCFFEVFVCAIVCFISFLTRIEDVKGERDEQPQTIDGTDY